MEGYDKRYTFWQGYRNAMSHLTDEQELRLRRAIDDFAFDGVMPEFEEAILALAWELIIPSLQKSMKLSEAGQRGGRGNKKPAEKGAFKGALKPVESQLADPFKPPFNEVEEEGEVEKERADKLRSFYSQTVQTVQA